MFVRRSRRSNALTFEHLEPRLTMTGVVINEFLATNIDGIVDQDGDHSDWIELKNTDATPVNLAGWYLTDDATNLTKWQLPSTNLAAGSYLTVFASDKNRAVAGQELHTNFKLSAAGEFLALVMPDGTTVASEFDPYPEQFDDVSYGPGASSSTMSNETLVGASSSLTVISPTAENAATDDHWTEIGFNDASWLAGTRSVGFDRDGNGTNFLPYIGRVLSTGEMPSTGSARYTAYVRYAFNLANKEQLTSLQLTMRFDDGFIAYINGREVQRANFGEDFVRPQPQWDSRSGYQMGSSTSLGAVNLGPEALTPVTFDLTPYLPELVNGENVLAFHLVNSASTSASGSGQDLLLEPVMTATRATTTAPDLFMQMPTPSADNGAGTIGIVKDTHFSVDRGFFTNPFQVAISSDTPGAQIRYTTDGSLPSDTIGALYAGPITVSTTSTLRAIAYKPGYVPTNVDTETYIFLADVLTQSAADITEPYATWGHDKEDADTTSGYNLDDESDWEMDPQIVSAYSSTIVNDLKAIPTVSLVMDWDDLFGGTPLPGTPAGSGAVAPAPQGIYIHGSSSERATSFEYFNPNVPSDTVHLDAAVEMQGHSSTLRWNSDKLSFQVKFKSPYGPTELNYPIFSGSPDGANATTEFDTLILDATFNYSWLHQNSAQSTQARYVTDQVVSDLQNLAGGAAAHGKYVHLYINGLYWGVYNIHERTDDSFASEYFGGSKNDYYAVKHASDDPTHKYTWVEGGIAAEQSYQTLLTATRAVESSPTSAAAYQAVVDQLDVDDFIDYMIVHYYAGNDIDWSNNNWYATLNHIDPAAKWHFHAWDQEHAFPTNETVGVNKNNVDNDQVDTPTELHRNLMANADYKLKFNDHVQKLLYNGGLLTPSVASAVYAARATEIDRAIVGESARWGDNRFPTDPFMRDDFVTVTNSVLNGFFPVRTGIVLGQFAAAGWNVSLAAPIFNNYGGEVASGFDVSITKPAGSPAAAQIYYTLDGSDPRLDNGTENPVATHGTGPFSVDISDAKQIKARIKNGTDWSPLIDATFTLPDVYPVRITELHYHPANHAGIADPDNLEFIELLNTGSVAVNLSGVQITQFATNPYVFGSITLAAGERIVVAKNLTVFQSVYGMGINLAPNDYGTANLSNGGERIALLGPAGEVLQDFVFDDVAPWPTAPDGNGPSLEIIDLLGDATDPANWRASLDDGGSPGTDGAAELLPGDYDGNHTVESADYDVWKAAFGASVAPGSGADGNGNGIVDAADYTVWRDHLGATQMGGAGSSQLFAAPLTEESSAMQVMPLRIATTEAVSGHGNGSPSSATREGLRLARRNSVGSTPDSSLLQIAIERRGQLAAIAPSTDSSTPPACDHEGNEDPQCGIGSVLWEDQHWLRSLASRRARLPG